MFPGGELHGEVGLGWPPGGMDQRGGCGLAEMDENLGDRLRVGQECDEGEGRLAGGTDEGKQRGQGWVGNPEVARATGFREAAPFPSR